MQKTFYFYTDPSHGWLKIPRRLLHDLGIAEKITRYSYERKDDVFLEEDADASTFINAFRLKTGDNPKFKESNAREKRSKIRSYDNYQVRDYAR